MTFRSDTYGNFVAEDSQARERLFRTYDGRSDRFDVIIVGSGIGGGVLADDLIDRRGDLRLLVLEAGSFLYPTHIYNICRFPNSSAARHFGCDTFWQAGDEGSENFIGEKPQLNLGGRSIFWSGLIPEIQEWELRFFPDAVRGALLEGGLLRRAGEVMNESRSMGTVADDIVDRLRATPLKDHFRIEQTPRALHQPYLKADGTPTDAFFTEPTGVFNTAELLINQLGLTRPEHDPEGPGLHLRLNAFVEDVADDDGEYAVLARDTRSGEARIFRAPRVVLAGGSIESPKLLRRSSLFGSLPEAVRGLVGRGLTDHPTSSELTALATHIGDVALPKTAHAKIILYSLGLRDGEAIRYPFNVEINVNHEYWHLRENDPSAPADEFTTNDPEGPSRINVKLSFGNPLDDANEIRGAPAFEYAPEIVFRNQSWMDRLTGERFPALANWQMTNNDVFARMNEVVETLFGAFTRDGRPAKAENNGGFGRNNAGFGWGTVHHAVGSLRMPYRPALGAGFASDSVVDEDLAVRGRDGLYVCDMSVMPFSSAANPVRTLVALSLRLSRHLA